MSNDADEKALVGTVGDGAILWRPDPAHPTAMHRFWAAVRERTGLPLPRYADLHRWSVEHFDTFWQMMLDTAELHVEGSRVPESQARDAPGRTYFPNVRLNFAENLLRVGDDPDVALVSIAEDRPTRRLTYAALRQRVASLRIALHENGVRPGDRVAGLVANSEEAVVAMLAATSIGAIWTSCSPDFGTQGIVDRFGQTTPRILFAVDGYRYGGKTFECVTKVREVVSRVPSIECVVMVSNGIDEAKARGPYGGERSRYLAWDDLVSERRAAATPTPSQWPLFPFDHPVYVLYSSGTTGAPKCIVHGAGGTLLQHAKELRLHSDLRRGDNIMYFTTCGWMMWNWLVSSLMTGATVTLFDGSPSQPSLLRLWEIVEDERLTHFGTSAKFLGACRGRISPSERAMPLDEMRVILSTGSPLLPEDFDWVYGCVKRDVQLSSISGGTDIVSCFMLGNPLLPVVRGEIQCLGLGMDVAAVDNRGAPVPFGVKGELVCRRPFPSMPVGFWNDPGHGRYRRAYFEQHGRDVWSHGDYIAITGTQGTAGGVIVHGRSDATLNPGGVRIGTAELYRLVETLPQVADSIAVGQAWQGDVRVVLFVQLAPGTTWDDTLEATIKETIRRGATPRHVPALVIPVAKIPYTMSGKKVELAVREIVEGREPVNKEALVDASALDCFRDVVPRA